MKRRRAREYALQMLFQKEFTEAGSDLAAFWGEKEEDEDVVSFANGIVRGTLENLAAIDGEIRNAAEHWVLERMAAVDRNILRAAAYEILYMEDIPPAVTINEALEIAKKYSSADSAAFINGILDRIAHKRKKLASP
jgi:N utilization substance protein B